MSVYSSSRSLDVALESAVAAFLDENFYGVLSEEKGVPFQRSSSKEEQFAGIDLRLGNTTIDEKVKIKGGYLNKVLDYPSFEISFVSEFDGAVTDGWFVKKGIRTDYYAFVSVFSDSVSDWKEIRSENISKLVVLFVKKSDVADFVNKYDGFSNIGESARHLRSLSWMGDDVHRFPHRKYHLKLSDSYPEKPVNLVIRRENLLKLQHTREILVTKDGWRRLDVAENQKQ